MKINKDELKQIWEMQKELDKRIHDKMGLSESETIDKRKIALIVELGEMLQEMPSVFKYWKRGAVDNREKALAEYIDVLHFALSLTNKNTLDSIIKSITGNDGLFWEFVISNIKCESYYSIVKDMFQTNIDILLVVIYVGIISNFTWSEIYQGYLAKNAINHERQDNNY